MRGEQIVQLGAVEEMQAAALPGDGRRRARQLLEQRHLAEEFAGLDGENLAVFTGGMLFGQLHFPGFEDEQGAADVSLEKNGFSGVVGARVERLRQVPELPVAQILEKHE